MARLLIALLVLVALAPDGWAQVVRPGDERLPRPGFETEGAPPPLADALPSVPDFPPEPRGRPSVLPPLDAPEGTAAEERVRIETVRIEGNTVVSDERLAAVAAPYEGRLLRGEDIQALRDGITAVYVKEGYVASGALIPDQSLTDGVLVLRIIEGGISAVDISVDGRLRTSYVESRLTSVQARPVRIDELRERLSALQRDPRIQQVEAALVPTTQRGEARLELRVVEADPWLLTANAANANSIAIGEWRGSFLVGHGNVTGFGDALVANYRVGAGLHDIRGNYDVPVTRWDTVFSLYMRRTWSEIVAERLRPFDITSQTQTYGLGLRQPVHRSQRSQLDLYLRGEWRRSESFLLGEPWSFVPGPVDGVATIAAIRASLDWRWSSSVQALAARTQLSFGLDVLDATPSQDDAPGGEFTSWLTQLEYARRFDLLDSQVVARAELQIAADPLLGLEQFALGGHRTVRGYTENFVVRDNGTLGSLELKVPIALPRLRDWRPAMTVGTFVDAGYSWNTDRPNTGPQTLVSVGLTATIAPTPRSRIDFYWGRPLVDDVVAGDGGAQDNGVYLGLTVTY